MPSTAGPFFPVMVSPPLTWRDRNLYWYIIIIIIIIMDWTPAQRSSSEVRVIQGGQKNGASVFHCKYFENPTTELRGSIASTCLLTY